MKHETPEPMLYHMSRHIERWLYPTERYTGERYDSQRVRDNNWENADITIDLFWRGNEHGGYGGALLRIPIPPKEG